MAGKDRPRPETVAMARAAQARRAGSIVPSGMSEGDQLVLAKILLRRLWRLLEHRLPDVFAGVGQNLDPDSRALVDRAGEAAAILWERDRIYVEPCRRILDSQRFGDYRYSLRRPGGDTCVIGESELLELAGVATADEPDFMSDLPF